jgi:hypothetical protein
MRYLYVYLPKGRKRRVLAGDQICYFWSPLLNEFFIGGPS